MRLALIAFAALAIGGTACVRTHYAPDLAALQLGTTKQEFVSTYSAHNYHGPIPRASKSVDGDQVDVLTMPLGGSGQGDYWFLFKNNRLVQWGKPEDWKSVAARYQIDVNGAPGVRSP